MRVVDTVLAICFMCGVARADVQEAKKHYERGTRAFNLQDWKGALAEFQRAYVEQSDPVFLFNIAQAQRQLGEYDAAAKSYRLYLANASDAPNRDQVTRLIEEMDKAAAEAHAKSPPTGTQAPATQPTSAPPVVVAKVPSRLLPMEIAGIVTADVGLALIGTGIAFAVVSKQAGDAAYHPASNTYDYAADQRQTNFRNGDIACFVIGGAALAVGTTIWMIGRKRRETSRTALVSSGVVRF
jgi:tetratricopeptide (TPR) repeat protein